MKRNRIFALGITLSMLAGLAACGNTSAVAPAKEENVTVDEADVEQPAETAETSAEVAFDYSPAEERPALEEGQMYSYLTGEVIDTEHGRQRPFAVMINNIQDAIPQSGISQADIIYECMVESDITRLMCEFQNIDSLGKLGSVRSARDVFLDLALDDEAIYTHFGYSPTAEARINAGYPSINGLVGQGGFYRTDDKEAPHNVYISNEGLMQGLNDIGATRDYSENYQPRLAFNNEDTAPEGDNARRVDMPFEYNKPYFEYHEDDGLYYRFQYDQAHIDVENNEQLKFKNLIVIQSQTALQPDGAHLDIMTTGSGTGMYFSDGKAHPIRWNRESLDVATHYFNEDGSPLYLNPGKTYIAYVRTDMNPAYSE